MSVDLLLDKNHDLALSERGDAILVDGQRQIAQQIEITLLTFLGEWFLDTTFGIPYFESILVKAPNRAEIESIIRAKIRDVPGVVNVPIVDVQVDAQQRTAVIEARNITTNEGTFSVLVSR